MGMMRLLGIDYGLVKVGLALADDGFAQPLRVIANNSRLLGKIIKICQANQIEKIVVGLPEGKIAKKVRKFAQKLSQATTLPIDFQDETLTSKEAIIKMIEGGRKRKARQEKEDAIAAALILESYLDV